MSVVAAVMVVMVARRDQRLAPHNKNVQKKPPTTKKEQKPETVNKKGKREPGERA